MTRLDIKGDTIVEVLIACAVISLVLVGSYATVNQSLKNSRQSQEHSEALKVAEGQIEALRGLAATSSSLFTAAAHQFCVTSLDTTPTIKFFSSTTYDPTNPSSYPTECQFNSLGSYKYSVSVNNKASDVNRFFVNIDWYGVTGKIDNVSLIYELYP